MVCCPRARRVVGGRPKGRKSWKIASHGHKEGASWDPSNIRPFWGKKKVHPCDKSYECPDPSLPPGPTLRPWSALPPSSLTTILPTSSRRGSVPDAPRAPVLEPEQKGNTNVRSSLGHQPIPPSPLRSQPLTVGLVRAGHSFSGTAHPAASTSPLGSFPRTPESPSASHLSGFVAGSGLQESSDQVIQLWERRKKEVEREAKKRNRSFLKTNWHSSR